MVCSSHADPSPKSSRSPRRITNLPIARPSRQKHGQRNESSEPEEHRYRLYAQNCKLMMRDRVRETPWDDDQIDEGEERPDGVEDHEVDLAGRGGVVVASPPVGDCSMLLARV